jgi:hypothetical protein
MATFISNYDPICHATCTGVGGVIGNTVTNLGSYTSPQGEDFTAYRVDYVAGGGFSYWFTLSNQGPFGITIIGIGGDTPSDVTRIERVQVQSNGTDHPVAFHAFSLAPDEFVNVLVTVRMAGCLEERSATTVGSVPVSFRILGIARSTTVYLPEAVEVTGRPGERCP